MKFGQLVNRVQVYLKGQETFEGFGARFQERNPEEHKFIDQTFSELQALKARTIPIDEFNGENVTDFVYDTHDTLAHLREARTVLKTSSDLAQHASHPEDSVRYRAAAIMLEEAHLLSSAPLTRSKAASIIKKARQEILG